MGELTTPRRVIAHVDADAFYATVHTVEDPTLLGNPVIVAGTGARSIVTTANYEARKYGVSSAMPAATARRLCPHAKFLRPDFDLYRDYSARAMTIIRELTAQVEPLSLDEAYLDITLVKQPLRMMRDTVAKIQAQTGLTYSVGIGPNKLCAKVLSDWKKPAAFNVASSSQCRTLFASCSPRIINGVGPKTTAQLKELGITTIAKLADAPDSPLIKEFGKRRARELQKWASFEHDGVVDSARERKSISEERTFDVDINSVSDLENILEEMSFEISRTLQKHALKGRTISIKLRNADFTTITRSRTIPKRTSDANVITTIATMLLREHAPEGAVRLLGVRVASFTEPASVPQREQDSGQLMLDLHN